jgi:hypothetical protein
MHLVIRVTLGQERLLHTAFLWLLGAFVLFICTMMITMLAIQQDPAREQPVNSRKPGFFRPY